MAPNRYVPAQFRRFIASRAGVAAAQQVSLWTNWRAPTGWRALDRPIRYVLEAAYSHDFGDSVGVLCFNDLTSLGVGLNWTAAISGHHHSYACDRAICHWTQRARRITWIFR